MSLDNQMQLRVRMVVYDKSIASYEDPEVWSDEPFYGADEMAIQAANLARELQKRQASDQ